MVTGVGFIVIREVERTEKVFLNNGYFSDESKILKEIATWLQVT